MKIFFLLFLSLTASVPAHAQNCADRDYRGLSFKVGTPPIYQEVLCQTKLLLKNRNNFDSLKQFIDLSEAQLGLSSKDLDWNQPLVGVINQLINREIEEGNVRKLGEAMGKFYSQGRYNLDQDEKSLISLLMMTEVQAGGQRL